MSKPILCVDFDGVLHSYTSPWKGAHHIPDPPVDGAMQFLEDCTHCFRVNIYSSRSSQPSGVTAMRRWLFDNMMHHFDGDAVKARDLVANLEFPEMKPPAFLTIDDRAITFTGTFPGMKELTSFRPWNKR